MAKRARQDGMSFIEMHVEKIVLAAAVVMLLYAVGHWVLSSPRRVPLAGLPKDKGASPEDVDGKLLSAAKVLHKWHNDAQPKPTPLPDLQKDIDALRRGPFSGNSVIAVGQPRTDLTDKTLERIRTPGGGMRLTVAELEQLAPKPSTPQAKVHYELPDTGAESKESPGSHPAATYSLRDATEAWRNRLTLISLHREPLDIIGVEFEVKVGDGPDVDWDAIEAQPAKLARLPGLIVVKSDVLADEFRDDFPALPPSCDETTIAKVLGDMTVIRTNLAELVHPTFYSILDKGGQQWVPWRKNLHPDPLLATGSQRPEEDDDDVEAPAKPAPARKAPMPVRRAAPVRRGAGAPGDYPDRDRYESDPTRRLGPGRSRRGAGPQEGYDPSRRVGPGERLDPGRRPAPGRERPGRPTDPGRRPGQAPKGREQVVIVPTTLDEQLQNGKLLIWCHDASIRPDKAYRYRIRVILRNPLLGHANLMSKTDKNDKPTDKYIKQAWLTKVTSPWSDWSQAVRAVKDMDFFLVHSRRKSLIGPANQGTVKVAVFTRQLGQLVSHEFVVDKGNLIGKVVPKNLKNPPPSTIVEAVAVATRNKPKATEKPIHSNKPVDFSTGAVVVDVNFRKSIFNRGQETKTTEIVYLDAEGQLWSCRLMKNLPEQSAQRKLYEKLQAEVDAEEAAKAAARAAARAATEATGVRRR